MYDMILMERQLFLEPQFKLRNGCILYIHNHHHSYNQDLFCLPTPQVQSVTVHTLSVMSFYYGIAFLNIQEDTHVVKFQGIMQGKIV